MRFGMIGWVSLFGSCTLGAAETKLQLYRPFTDNHQSFTVISKKSGNCSQQSQRIMREDAWQCSADGQHYDPCFVNPFGSHQEAFCPKSPWTAEAVKITVASALNNQGHQPLDMSKNYPWAVELMDGNHCLAIESSKQYEGMPVRYLCAHQIELIGHLQRCKLIWSMVGQTSNGLETLKIQRAWF